MAATAESANNGFTPVNFQVAHQLKRRVRITAPALHKDPERTYILEILLNKHPEIKGVRAVADIASVVVYFDHQRLPKANLFIMLDKILGNIGCRAPGAHQERNRKPSGAQQELSLAVEGMTCVSCALLIEVILNRDPHIGQATVNYASGTASVQGALSREELFERISQLGYTPRPMDTLAQRRLLIERERASQAEAGRRAAWAGLLSLPVILIGMAMPRARSLHWIEFLLTTPVVLWTGRHFFTQAWKLAKQRSANMDTLIALGTGAAYTYSVAAMFNRRHHLYFEAAGSIITFVLLGQYLEKRTKGKAGEAIRGLIDLQPRTATLLRNGEEITIDAEEIQVGDLLLVRPGELIPTDGEVVEGLSSVDESMVTGESLPAIKEPGHKLVGGCINGSGVLRMRTTAVGGDTVLAGIIRMVDQAQSARLPLQKIADRISAVFVPTVMKLAGMTFLTWYAVGGGLPRALGNTIAVLLIACPCAVGLATPIAVMVGTGQAARRGVYIRNGESLETASQLTVIIFDKTGTITEGQPRVTNLINISTLTDEKILALAASAETDSEHFLGQAIIGHANERNLTLSQAKGFRSSPGQGIESQVNGRKLTLGNRAWLEAQGIDVAPFNQQVGELTAAGKTPVFVGIDGKPVALFGIADRPREGAKDSIARLHALGIETLMVTGDTEATAAHIAQEVGITQVVAQATPERKLEIVRELQANGAHTGMIGDGINDAPALAASDVSFAVGTGTDIAIEAADMILVNGDIAKVAEVVELSGRTMRIIKQNLFWALSYNTVAIPVAAAGKLSPMIASAAMAMSSVSVVTNSLRLQQD